MEFEILYGNIFTISCRGYEHIQIFEFLSIGFEYVIGEPFYAIFDEIEKKIEKGTSIIQELS